MSTTRKYGGTGLGLNLVKQLVEAHGGQIGVQSKIGLGTTFSFTVKVYTSYSCVRCSQKTDQSSSDDDAAHQTLCPLSTSGVVC